MAKFVVLMATFFGSGYAPKAPGTFGTVAAIPVVLLFYLTGDLGYIALTLAFTIFSIFICQYYESIIEGHDRKEVVIDEVAGFLVTMALVPPSLLNLILGFGLFRLFDIIKPYPISYLDRKVEGGLGVVIDDIAAGIFANILLHWLAPIALDFATEFL